MRLVLALPRLLALDPATLAGMRGLARLAAAASSPARVPAGIDAAFARAAGAPADASLAYLAALGAGLDPGTLPLLYADPVTLVAGRDDVLFGGRVDDLADAEAQALVAKLNAHFAADGIAFHAPRADAWFVAAEAARDLATTPPAAIDGAIYPHLPHGARARDWRRWLSEAQMLLHDHPVNAAREARGRPPVTGLWPWGEGGVDRLAVDGPAVDGPATDRPAVATTTQWYAPAGRTGDVARGLALRAGAEAMPLAGPATPAHAAVAAWVRAGADVHAMLPALRDAADAMAVDARWLVPAADALMRGDIASLTLIADAGGTAFAWRATQPPLLRRLRDRFGVPPFAAPRPEDHP